MIIITVTKDFFHCKNLTIVYCKNNDYISSIEYIDNIFDDIIVKTYKKSLFAIEYFNLKYQLHNPIGPAIIRDYGNNREGKYYYINNKFINYETNLNDYNKL